MLPPEALLLGVKVIIGLALTEAKKLGVVSGGVTVVVFVVEVFGLAASMLYGFGSDFWQDKNVKAKINPNAVSKKSSR